LGPAEQKIKLQELAQYLYELILLFKESAWGQVLFFAVTQETRPDPYYPIIP
jgi:hypothetical protein